MDRDSGTRPGLRPPAQWLAALCALVTAGGVGVALAWSAAAGPWSGTPGLAAPSMPGAWIAWQAVALMVLLGGAVVALRLGWQDRHSRAELRDAREQLRCIDELLDVWQWQTDAAHCLVLLRPPRGASPADWSAAVPGAPLWQHLREVDKTALRARIDIRAPLDDLEVQNEPGTDLAPARRFLLRGRARTDASGRFAGYQGTSRDLCAASPADVVAGTGPTDTTAPMPVSGAAIAGDPRLPTGAPAPDAADAADVSDHESFSFTVSHDLRAPIRVVEGFTKIVKEDYGQLLDRVGNDHLDRVLGAAARMNNMIDALLALSNLSSQPLARQPVNLSQLAGYVVDDLRRQWPERTVAVSVEASMLVHGDPTLLRVVLENLIGNAWKYSAKAAEPQIEFKRVADQRNTFCVRDNGAGFDMRFADRLFGVFQRLHSANDFPGTGVGLASVRRIVRRHGGEIWGEAEVNRGACFYFTLPQGGPRN